MSSETQPPEQDPSQTQPAEIWTTPHLESALAHLERLQDQIDHLRSAIPSLVKPLYSRKRSYSDSLNQTSGSLGRATQIFTGVRDAAAQTAEDLRVLGEIWRGEETRAIFERVRESEGREGDLGMGVGVGGWGSGERVEERKLGEVEGGGA